MSATVSFKVNNISVLLMTTEKQIQVAVTKYKKLKADNERLYRRYQILEARYYEAKRKRDDALKKSQNAAKKTSEYDDALKKRGILKDVERRVYGY